jgi:hypothetical protein
MFHDLTKEKESEEIIRALSANHVSVREEERKRIAREIHDDLGQRLSLLRMDVLMLPKAVGDNDDGLTNAVARMRDDIDNCIGIARDIVSDLRPAVLDFGIVPAIEWLLDEFETRTKIKCLFHDLTEGEIPLNDQQATGMFRILQESLTNVAKHANAGTVEVELESLEDCLCLEIADNGVGIDPDRIRNPNSYGLIGLRERAAMLGCELRVSSLRGQGTTVRICIPLRSCASPSCSRINQ